MWKPKPKGYVYVQDKCNPPIDLGSAMVFPDALPGINDNIVKPFGWTEYESAYRHQYVPDPCPSRRPCRDPCKTRAIRKPPHREFQDPCRKAPRLGICNLCHLVKCNCAIPPPWEESREKVVIYDPDSVRNLFVHHELKTEHPVVLGSEQYCRLMNRAIVRTKEEKEEECRRAKEPLELELEKCRSMAEEMRLIDSSRCRDSFSPEAREDMNEILCRADKILKETNEPEIRTINQVILTAKVQAIREAQLAEKVLIKCEQAEEENRIIELLKQDAEYALIKNDGDDLETIEEKKKLLRQVMQLQLDEKEAQRLLEKEVQEVEREELRRVWEKEELEDMTKRTEVMAKKHELGKALMANQLEIIQQKQDYIEFNRKEDIRLMEELKQKQEAEDKAQQDRKEQWKRKYEALESNSQSKKNQIDAKIYRDELRIRRQVEEQEREWRRRERDKIKKKQEDARDLRRDILNQIRERQDIYCEQATYDKAMYDKIYDLQSQKFEDEKQLIDMKKQDNLKYHYDLCEQIHNYQLRRIKERKDDFIEGISLRRSIAQRDRELKCTMDRKLEELRESCLPEKYVEYVRKQIDVELKPHYLKRVRK